MFGYLAARGVNVPRFSADWDMTTAILRHAEEAWRPLSIEVKRRETTDPRLAGEVNIRTGRESGYGGWGPTREVAICKAALFLVAIRERKWIRPEERVRGALLVGSSAPTGKALHQGPGRACFQYAFHNDPLQAGCARLALGLLFVPGKAGDPGAPARRGGQSDRRRH